MGCNARKTNKQHTIENRHEYGKEVHTLTVLKLCRKGSRMDASENFFIQTVHQQGMLIEEQQVNDPNPLYRLVQTLQTFQPGYTQSTEHATVQGGA
jgi:hypothetical protein